MTVPLETRKEINKTVNSADAWYVYKSKAVPATNTQHGRAIGDPLFLQRKAGQLPSADKEGAEGDDEIGF